MSVSPEIAPQILMASISITQSFIVHRSTSIWNIHYSSKLTSVNKMLVYSWEWMRTNRKLNYGKRKTELNQVSKRWKREKKKGETLCVQFGRLNKRDMNQQKRPLYKKAERDPVFSNDAHCNIRVKQREIKSQWNLKHSWISVHHRICKSSCLLLNNIKMNIQLFVMRLRFF